MLSPKKLVIVLLFFIVLMFNQTAQAQSSWFFGLNLSEGRGHHERSCRFLPHGYRSIGFGEHKYFYYDGVYYQGAPGDYYIVQAPLGVVVSTLPFGCHKVWISGRYYFENSGTYYLPVRGGYEVVQTPWVVQPPMVARQYPMVVDQHPMVVAPTTGTHVVANDAKEELTINIPNAQGGYTPVILRRSGNGFIGPQGEYYSEFPRVAQLKVVYGK